MAAGSPNTQSIVQGPVASQIAIKMLGTNGGGYYNANAAHPFENPTPLSNFIQMLSIFAIPSALTYYLGKMVKNQGHGWAVLAAMMVVFLGTTMVSWHAEARGNPHMDEIGIAQTGNFEGKEVRFGIFNSALFANVTTDASCGAVNSMHDSFTPLGGMMPMLNIELGEIIFGGVGAGLYGMLVFIVIAIFIAGLMVGRTPEYLGKKIESFDVKAASLAVLILTFTILGFTAWAAVTPWGQAATNNGGPHGFSEILYAFSSCTGNNGSAFAGLTGNPTSGDFASTALQHHARPGHAAGSIHHDRSDHRPGGKSREEEIGPGQCRKFPRLRRDVCRASGQHDSHRRRTDVFPGIGTRADRRTFPDARRRAVVLIRDETLI